MDEFWVCQHCRSLNRAGTDKCYSCREKYGTKPPEGAPLKTHEPPPLAVLGPLADFSARPDPVVATFSRPTPVSFTEAAAEAARTSRGPSRSLNPFGAVGHRLSAALALRQSVSVGWLGYLTAGLLVVFLAIGGLLIMTVLPAATHLLQHADAAAAWAQLSEGAQSMAATLSMALVAICLLALLCFSAFVGLTTHNATGLGAEQPLLTPYRAGVCWAAALWTQVRLAVGLIVPAVLVWRGYAIPGLIAAIVALEIGHRHLDDSGGWASRPYRHLPDLYAKLGVDKSIGSPLASVWSACFRIANGMAIAVWSIPLVGVIIWTASLMAGRGDLINWQSSGLGAAQIAVALLVSSLVGWTAAAVALLVPILLGLVQRQRTRKTLVRVGRSRSWVARPGEGEYAGAQSAASARPEHHEAYDEDRIVERLPDRGPERFDAQPYPAQPFGIPDDEEPRVGRPGTSGLGFGDPDDEGPFFGGR